MWLSTLHFLWSSIVYFLLSVVLVTLIGAWKKLSQEKDKAAQSFPSHLSPPPPPLPPTWPSRAASNASTDSVRDTDDDDDVPPRPSRTTPPSHHHLPPPSRAANDRAERDRRRSRDGVIDEEEEEPLHSPRRRRRGLEEEEEEGEEERGMDREEEEGEGGGDEEREEEADPSLPIFHLPPHHRHHSHSSPSSPLSPSSLAPHPPLTPLHLPSPSIIVYLEFARLIRSLWLRGELRMQGMTVERLMEKERERGRLVGVALEALRELMKFYGRRKRPEGRAEEGGGGEGEGRMGEVDEDVYALMNRGEVVGGEDEGDEARVRAVNAAVAMVAVIGQEERQEGRGQQGERERGEAEQEKGEPPSVTGELNLRLQRLLALPLPALPPLSPPHTKISITSPSTGLTPSSVGPSPALVSLPSIPPFDPFAATTTYLSDSHSIRCAIAQQLCTDRPDALDSAERAPAASSSASTPGTTASAAASSPFPALRPVYATPALQTRYLNVELMGEMELVLFRLQRRLEQAMLDNLNHFVAAAHTKQSPAQPPPPAQSIPLPASLAQHFVTPPTASAAAAGPSPPSARSTASSISPGAPVPALPPATVVTHRSASSDTFHPAVVPVSAHAITRARAASTTTANGLPYLPVEPRRPTHHHTLHSLSVSAKHPSAPVSTVPSSATAMQHPNTTTRQLKPSPSYRSASPASTSVTSIHSTASAAVRPYTASAFPYYSTTPSLPPRPPSSGESSPVRVMQPRVVTGDLPVRREPKVVSYALNGENGVGDGDSGRPRLRGHHRSKSLIGTARFSM